MTTDTSEEEQAVSTTIDGPLQPYAYDIFPLKKARRVPSSVNGLVPGPAKVNPTCGIIHVDFAREVLHIVICGHSNIAPHGLGVERWCAIRYISSIIHGLDCPLEDEFLLWVH
jgi:hypothetical protein